MTQSQAIEANIARSTLNDSILREMVRSEMPTRDGYEFVVHVVPSQKARCTPTGTYLHLVK